MIKLTNNENWLRRMAELEDGCSIRAGTLELRDVIEILKSKEALESEQKGG